MLAVLLNLIFCEREKTVTIVTVFLLFSTFHLRCAYSGRFLSLEKKWLTAVVKKSSNIMTDETKALTQDELNDLEQQGELDESSDSDEDVIEMNEEFAEETPFVPLIVNDNLDDGNTLPKVS